MTENRTESWGTSSFAADQTAPRPVERPLPDAAAAPAEIDTDAGRHAVLPGEPVAEAPTSYGTFFKHPPYATEEAPMTVDVPEVTQSRPMPQPAPVMPPVMPEPTEASPSRGRGQESVTCPECGHQQPVNINQRSATDFCRRCDFPLFWVPSRISRDWNQAGATEALRRLPGTGGATRLASLACPHCAERNPATADICSRCGRSMHLEPAPPPQAPVYVAPAPEPEPAPPRSVPWWVWTLVGTVAVALVFLVLWLTDVITL